MPDDATEGGKLKLKLSSESPKFRKNMSNFLKLGRIPTVNDLKGGNLTDAYQSSANVHISMPIVYIKYKCCCSNVEFLRVYRTGGKASLGSIQ